MSLTIEVAEAVETAINAASFSITPDSVVRSFFPEQRLSEIGTDLVINIVPGNRAIKRSARSRFEETIEISVSVEKKLTARTNAVIDPLIALTEEVEDLLRARLTTAGSLDCIWTETSAEIPWSYDILKQEGLYFSLSKFTYRIDRG